MPDTKGTEDLVMVIKMRFKDQMIADGINIKDPSVSDLKKINLNKIFDQIYLQIHPLNDQKRVQTVVAVLKHFDERGKFSVFKKRALDGLLYLNSKKFPEIIRRNTSLLLRIEPIEERAKKALQIIISLSPAAKNFAAEAAKERELELQRQKQLSKQRQQAQQTALAEAKQHAQRVLDRIKQRPQANVEMPRDDTAVQHTEVATAAITPKPRRKWPVLAASSMRAAFKATMQITRKKVKKQQPESPSAPQPIIQQQAMEVQAKYTEALNHLENLLCGSIIELLKLDLSLQLQLCEDLQKLNTIADSLNDKIMQNTKKSIQLLESEANELSQYTCEVTNIALNIHKKTESQENVNLEPILESPIKTELDSEQKSNASFDSSFTQTLISLASWAITAVIELFKSLANNFKATVKEYIGCAKEKEIAKKDPLLFSQEKISKPQIKNAHISYALKAS